MRGLIFVALTELMSNHEGNFKGMITSTQKKQLKKLAHHLDPVVIVGHQGVTDSIIAKTEEGLLSHELIKIKFGDYRDEKSTLAESLAKTTDSHLIDIIGHIAILYRPQPDPQKRRIRI